MMSVLARKELRSLLPFALLLLFFSGLDWVYLLASEFPDQYPLAEVFNEAEENETLILLFIMAFAMGLGLLTRERDEQTLEFLDALPVTRTRIFITKFGLASLALWMLPLSDFCRGLFFQTLSRNSLDHSLHLGLLAGYAVVEMSMALVFLSVGLALGFLRRFSFLVLGLAFWGYVLCREWNLAGAAYLNPFTVTDTVFHGQRWIVPWRHVLTQWAIGALSFGLAWLLFLGSGDRASRLISALRRWPGAVVVGAGVTVVIVLIWGGFALYYLEREVGHTEEPSVEYASWGNVWAASRHYRFLYPANLGEGPQSLISRADAIEEKVRRCLGAQAGGKIVVDLTGTLPRHAGRAYWKRIRMPWIPGQDPAVVDSILGHETTHIYIDLLSDSRLTENFNSTRFFHEGLAAYVEYHLFLSAQQLARSRRVAAVMWFREQVEIEELVNNEQLQARYDGDLVYPLGEAFVAALVQRHGPEAPGRVLRAMGRDSAPRDLQGMELWQDTFQACGYNFSEVTETFFALLDQTASQERTFVEAIPRLGGAVSYEQGWIRVTPVPPEAGQVVCRFRARRDSPDRFYQEGFLQDGSFSAAWADLQGPSFWYQLGWASPQLSQPVYEPWVEVRRGL